MRNVTTTLTGETLTRSAFYAERVAGFLGGEDTLVFAYSSRTGTVSEREAVPTEIVGTPGTSSHGFKGETPNGPRTFNFHLMG